MKKLVLITAALLVFFAGLYAQQQTWIHVQSNHFVQLASDAFTGTSGTYLGANWQPCGKLTGVFNNLQYRSNQAGGDGNSNIDCSLYTGAGVGLTPPNDQYAQATVVVASPASVLRTALELRGSTAPSIAPSYIGCGWDALDFGDSNGHYRIWSQQSGASTPVSLLLTTITPATNDVIWCQVRGKLVLMMQNGTVIGAAYDTSGTSSGWAGMLYNDPNTGAPPAGDVIWDAFSVGYLQTTLIGRLGQVGTLTWAHITPPPPPPSGTGENGYCSINTDASCFVGNLLDGPAALPTQGMYTGMDGTPSPGPTVTANLGGTGLQAALNSAVCGEIIQVPPLNGAVQNQYTPIVLPALGCDKNHWITIETASINATGFPAEHVRATPCQINLASVANYPSYSCSSPAFLMPRIQATSGGGTSSEPITLAAGANYYRIIGIELGVPHGIINDLYLADMSGGGDHIILDRDILHGETVSCTLGGSTGTTYACNSADQKGGWQSQGATNVALINSWVYDIACPQGSCTDAVGVGGGNGAIANHTIKIWNDFISSAGESWIFGGSGNGVGSTTVTPTDIEIRGNYSYKPVSYLLCTKCSGSSYPEFKNLGEIKNAIRVLVEGNRFENSWSGWQTDQSGYAFLLTPKNQANSVNITASSDSTGTILTATGTGVTWPSSITSPNCGQAFHCGIAFGTSTINTFVQSITDPTHIVVSPAVTVSTSANAKTFTPGLNPTAIDTDVTYRFNRTMNTTNAVQFAAATSDGGDRSLGIHNVSIHDNLFEGVNYQNDNNAANNKAVCLQITNGQAAPANVYNYLFEHNTCMVVAGLPFSLSGLDNSLDETNTDSAGATGQYFSNETIRNNLGPAGGQVAYKAGSIYPGGLVAGLKQQGCTPAVTGTTCTWIYTENVLGIGLWTSQNNNTPFPSTNQTCGVNSATCFPNGPTAWHALFQNYFGPAGQPAYLGNFKLANGSTYALGGTDNRDIGIGDWTTWTNLQSVNASYSTTYTPAAFTTTSLPVATQGTNYDQNVLATSASPFQWVMLDPSTPSLPAGLQLQVGPNCNGPVWCIIGNPTATGTFSFQLDLYDGAQQYATHTYSLTVNPSGSGGPSTNANWQVAATIPSACASVGGINFGAIRNSSGGGGVANEWYITCHTGSIYKSTNQGASWTDISAGLTWTAGMFSVQVNTHNGSLIVATQGNPVNWYISTNDGSSWTQVVPTGGYKNTAAAAHQGCGLPWPGHDDNLICGGLFGSIGTSAWYSSNDGASAITVTTGTSSSTYALATSDIDGSKWLGSETAGVYKSTDGGQTWTNVLTTCPSPCSGSYGNISAFAFDPSGNPVFNAQGGIWKGIGSGTTYTWTHEQSWGIQGDDVYKDSLNSMYASNGGAVHSVFRSLDGGVTFTAWDTGFPNSQEVQTFVENPADGKIYAFSQAGLYSTPK